MRGTSVVLHYLRTHLSALGHEIRFWHTTSAKILFSLQVIIALGLSVLVSEKLGLHFAWWAALSSFAVTRTTPNESVVRAFQRVLGTVTGGVSGALVALIIIQHIDVSIALCALVGGYAVYRANESPWSYAWVLGAVTAMMVMLDAQTATSVDAVIRFMFSRIAEVVTGVTACVLTGFAFRLILPLFGIKEKEKEIFPAPDDALNTTSWRTKRIALGIEAGIAIFIVALFLLQSNVGNFSQAIITILALLILPAGKKFPETSQQILDRMMQRLVGCLLAGVMGLLLLPLLYGQPWVYTLVLMLGLWMGCHLQQGSEQVSYTGRQFTVAWIMIFIQQHYWLADPDTAILRFYGIMLGVITLAVVMLTVHSLKAYLSKSA